MRKDKGKGFANRCGNRAANPLSYQTISCAECPVIFLNQVL